MMTTPSNNRAIFKGQNCPTRGILLRFYPSPQPIITAVSPLRNRAEISRLEKLRALLTGRILASQFPRDAPLANPGFVATTHKRLSGSKPCYWIMHLVGLLGEAPALG
jgi:hypothetical protein